MKEHQQIHYSVEVNQPRSLGSPWVVRVFTRKFFFKNVISSDWFLSEGQARHFAKELVGQLSGGTLTIDAFRKRKPGWALHTLPHR